MSALYPQNIYFVEDGQTDVTLDMPFTLGGSLAVYINGVFAVLGQDYIEVDAITIRFNYQLSSSDVIITKHSNVTNQKVTVINDTPKPSLYKKYGEAQTLLPNQKYTLKLVHGEQEFESTFFTILDPFYSTYEVIAMDLGAIVEDIPRDRILLLIHNNSIISQNIASEENLELLESEEKTPFVFRQYVRYRTELDIMMNRFLEASLDQGRVKKMLGELEIEREGKFSLNDVKGLIDDLKKKLAKAEKDLVGFQTKTIAASAVRGGSDSYPLATPRRGFSSPPAAATSGESE